MKRWPTFAIAAVLLLAAGAAVAGYIDPAHLAAAPLAVPLFFAVGDTENFDPVAMTRLKLKERGTLSDANMAILNKAKAEGRDITAEELKTIDANLAKIGVIEADVKRLQAVADASRAIEVGGKIISTEHNQDKDPKRGFANLGDFAIAVKAANPEGGGAIDQRLRPLAGATTFGNESAGGDGGYLVPTEFSTEITKLSLDSDNFLTKCDATPISGNSMAFPSDETTPWGTNGIRAYWAAEAAQATQTKPVLKPNVLRLNKLFALVPVTDELLADAPAISAYLNSEIAQSIKWKSNDAVINGTGAGQPLGVLKSAGLVVVAKESGQAASTVLPANIAKMFAAMPPGYLAGAEWVIAPDAFPAIMTLTLGNYPLYMPPVNGIQGAPSGFLLGKPINLSQSAAAFSAQGDVSLVNFKAYRTISKEVQLAQSMHLYFDFDETAFRATFRLDGQPKFKTPIVQARGSQNLSPYVTLQNR